jgi:hypothetical protein
MWADTQIPAGQDWRETIEASLQQATVVLLLVSIDYLVSQPCQAEMNEALRRRTDDGITVIGIILRPCDWQATTLERLQVLPSGARPLVAWEDRDAACLDVARGIMRVVHDISARTGVIGQGT